MQITVLGTELQLLPEKAIYVEHLQMLLVSDVHLGKSETFQAAGIPISNRVNQDSLDRLQALCLKMQPKTLIILGDLFHSRFSLVKEVLDGWSRFLDAIDLEVKLIIGNHDRALINSLSQLSITCFTDALQCDRLLLSHEPCSQPKALNICGHIHPCVRLRTKLDNLRLPCFYLEQQQKRLVLPSFGAFTGGYEVELKPGSTAYVIAENTVVAFEG
ncbi:MAG: ligase-associated DNA damage response endonuclease PdeM [Tildeniella nuda ZEHNDER 1965/U140]|jgi:DNA ligase-associated metallophosphoesterase|nr:ligase-associated DNA damage response endonuclease PdeM [Tildeniella nuda ZEHNDER 1965/U140]